MKIFRTISAVKKWRNQVNSVGFIPTMGDLHEGHLALVQAARLQRQSVCVSIFVNPTQFNQRSDFLLYRRNTKKDLALLRKEKVDAVFLPKSADLYPQNFSTWVDPGPLAQPLCGKYRPGHFRGVATIVLKLFAIVQPQRAYFGLKDYQQFKIIEKMVQDFNLSIQVLGVKTVRAPNGLALSSRNQRLSQEGQKRAASIYAALRQVSHNFSKKPTNLRKRFLESAVLAKQDRVEYLECVDPQTLLPLKKIRPPFLLAAAVWIEKTRLIDNILVGS